MTYLTAALLIVVAIQALAIFVLATRGERRARAEQVLRESEQRFRLMLGRAPVMIRTARPDTTLDYVNGTCVEFTQLPIEKLLDNGWLDAVHPDDRDRYTRTCGPALEARAPFLMEYRLRRADGVYRWVLDSGVPKYGADGSYSGHIGCSIDITERKDAEDRLRESLGRGSSES